MKEHRMYRARSVPGESPWSYYWRQIVFYPTSYADFNAAIADIANLEIVLFLHGAGEQNWPEDYKPYDDQTQEDLALDILYTTDLPKNLKYTGTNKNEEGYIVICPQLDGQYTQWDGNAMLQTQDMIEREFAGAKAYHVTGLSRGGQGTYNFIANDPYFYRTAGCLAGNSFQADPSAWPIPNDSITDIRHWHGENDTATPNHYNSGVNTRNLALAAGYTNEFTFVTLDSTNSPTYNAHNIWPEVYYNTDAYFDWIKTKNERDGFTFKYDEKITWRDRATNGPWKTEGDVFSYSPGAWDKIPTIAAKLMNDEVDEYWDGDFLTGNPPAYQYGYYLLACAFYYLIKGDATYGRKAKDAILAQIRNSNPVFEDYMSAETFGDSFHFTSFTCRMFVAFDYTYDMWSTYEIEELETYYDRATDFYQYALEYPLYKQFPNRDAGDYDTRAWWAATGAELDPAWPEFSNYTHYTAGGTPTNQIYKAHAYGYGNGESIRAMGCTLWGLYKNDSSLITAVKKWVKECLMFGTWGDGMYVECIRNGSDIFGETAYGYGTMAYGIIVYEVLFLTAELFRKNLDDTELYEYSTSYGMWGTEGTIKSLKLLLDTLEENCRSTVLRYYGTPAGTDNLLDTYDPDVYRYTPEMTFGIANQYYGDKAYENIYLQNASGIRPYSASDTYFDWVGGDLSQWMGMSHIFPALPLMYYAGQGNQQGSKSLLI
jgi:hypothetical protein